MGSYRHINDIFRHFKAMNTVHDYWLFVLNEKEGGTHKYAFTLLQVCCFVAAVCFVSFSGPIS